MALIRNPSNVSIQIKIIPFLGEVGGGVWGGGGGGRGLFIVNGSFNFDSDL